MDGGGFSFPREVSCLPSEDVEFVWSAVLTGVTRAELVCAVPPPHVECALYVQYSSLYHNVICLCLSHCLEQGRAKSRFDLSTWLEENPKEEYFMTCENFVSINKVSLRYRHIPF